MEGIAAQARVSKQTIHRTRPSTSAVLFSALLDQARPMVKTSIHQTPKTWLPIWRHGSWQRSRR
ncbi:MAG: hypothetical protein H0X12_02860 [Nocardioides sp.]|nr:hypothetical protein [Nocardioides sp.]